MIADCKLPNPSSSPCPAGLGSDDSSPIPRDRADKHQGPSRCGSDRAARLWAAGGQRCGLKNMTASMNGRGAAACGALRMQEPNALRRTFQTPARHGFGAQAWLVSRTYGDG